MQSLLEVVRKTEGFFTQKGMENPRLNAELLFAHGLGCKRLDLYLQFDRPLDEAFLEKMRPLVARRGKGEPLQYILGEVEFFGLRLKVDERALIPRPETEELAEWLIAQGQEKPPTRILDLGTGTGALALALATAFPEAQVWAVDQSTEALALAQENAERLELAGRVSFAQSNWFEALEAGSHFDWIVSNPPYLTDEEWQSAAIEVRDWEPRAALVAPEEGTADLAHILTEAREWLAPEGRVALETGIAQHAQLGQIAEAQGYTRTESRQDLSGRDRFFIAYV